VKEIGVSSTRFVGLLAILELTRRLKRGEKGEKEENEEREREREEEDGISEPNKSGRHDLNWCAAV
jgi:hypothetical protein